MNLKNLLTPKPSPELSEQPTRPPSKSITTPMDDVRFASAQRMLDLLKDAADYLERESALLSARHHLYHRPKDDRARAARDRLEFEREFTDQFPSRWKNFPAQQRQAVLAKPVSMAIKIIDNLLSEGAGEQSQDLLDPQDPATRIERLNKWAGLLQVEVRTQASIVKSLHHEISDARARHLYARHRELVIARHQAKLALAAAEDALTEFRNDEINAGFGWRADVLRQPASRSTQILGSEKDWNSEISCETRTLQEWRYLEN